MERSTYVLATSAALILLFAAWQPMGGVVWYIENTGLRDLLYTVFGLGWLIGPLQHISDQPLRPVRPAPGLAQSVQKALYLAQVRYAAAVSGWCATRSIWASCWPLWATPVMTAAHLLLAIGLTAYIFMGIRLKEKDLVDALPEYAEYRKQVPMILPVPKRNGRAADALAGPGRHRLRYHNGGLAMGHAARPAAAKRATIVRGRRSITTTTTRRISTAFKT